MCTGVETALIVSAFASTAATAAQASSASNNKPKAAVPAPAKANKTQADSDIAKTLKNRQTTGSKVARSPTLLTSGGSAGIQDSQLNLSKSLIGG